MRLILKIEGQEGQKDVGQYPARHQDYLDLATMHNLSLTESDVPVVVSRLTNDRKISGIRGQYPSIPRWRPSRRISAKRKLPN